MVDKIPEEQWAIQIREDGTWDVDRVKVPRPGPGQVLVKVECAPINPSDTYFLAGMYGKAGDDGPARNIQYPITPGWEGAGVVVQNGGGLMGWRVMGKRVAITKC
jgi:NADPH:quinone reductase-like Zn-dependent oxidoreductase